MMLLGDGAALSEHLCCLFPPWAMLYLLSTVDHKPLASGDSGCHVAAVDG